MAAPTGIASALSVPVAPPSAKTMDQLMNEIDETKKRS
jgi:hypothetical protein